MNRKTAYYIAGFIGMVGLAVTGYFAFIAPTSRREEDEEDSTTNGEKLQGYVDQGPLAPTPSNTTGSGTEQQPKVDFSWTVKPVASSIKYYNPVKVGTLTGDHVNIRKGAGTQYDIHANWRKNVSFPVVGETSGQKVNGSAKWYVLNPTEPHYYVHSSLVKLR